MATMLDRYPGESTAAASPVSAMAEAARAEAARKKTLEDQRAKSEQLQQEAAQQQITHSGNAEQRATQDQQMQVDKARREQLPHTMSGDALQWDTPDTKGKSWSELPPYTRQHFVDAYSDIAGDAPTIWNEAQRQATGDDTIGRQTIPTPTPGQTVERGPTGGITTRQTYQPPEQPANLGTGDEAISDMRPEEANMVRQIANYQLPVTSLSRLPPETKMRILARVSQFEPTFSATEYPARQALTTSLKSGPLAQNITAANTAVSHLDTLMEKAKELHNRSFTPWNAVANAAGKTMGNDAVTNFEGAANAVVSELAKVFKGAGVVPQQEINHWRENLSPNMSPDQMKGAVQTALELMGGRFSAIDDQYQRGIGKPRNFAILNPKTRAILRSKLGVDPDAIESIPGPSEAPAPAEAQAQPQIPTLTDKSQFDALQSGAEYIRNGVHYRKP